MVCEDYAGLLGFSDFVIEGWWTRSSTERNLGSVKLGLMCWVCVESGLYFTLGVTELWWCIFFSCFSWFIYTLVRVRSPFILAPALEDTKSYLNVSWCSDMGRTHWAWLLDANLHWRLHSPFCSALCFQASSLSEHIHILPHCVLRLYLLLPFTFLTSFGYQFYFSQRVAVLFPNRTTTYCIIYFVRAPNHSLHPLEPAVEADASIIFQPLTAFRSHLPGIRIFGCFLKLATVLRFHVVHD